MALEIVSQTNEFSSLSSFAIAVSVAPDSAIPAIIPLRCGVSSFLLLIFVDLEAKGVRGILVSREVELYVSDDYAMRFMVFSPSKLIG